METCISVGMRKFEDFRQRVGRTDYLKAAVGGSAAVDAMRLLLRARAPHRPRLNLNARLGAPNSGGSGSLLVLSDTVGWQYSMPQALAPKLSVRRGGVELKT
jgi:hypothetical protein